MSSHEDLTLPPGRLVKRTVGRAGSGLRFIHELWAGDVESEPFRVVAMHGMGGSPSNWNLVAPRLGNVSLTRIEMPLHEGLCARSATGRRIDADDVADTVSQTVDELCESPVHIVGHSMGVYFAVRSATANPEKVIGVVSLSGCMFGLSDSLITGTIRSGDTRELRRLRLNFAGAVLMTMLPPIRPLRWMLDNIRVTRGGLHPYLNRRIVTSPDSIGGCFAGQGGLVALKITEAASRGANIREAFANCPVPIRAVVGDRDPLLISSDYDELHSYVVCGQYLTIHDIGHWPHIEAPRQVAKFIVDSIKAG